MCAGRPVKDEHRILGADPVRLASSEGWTTTRQVKFATPAQPVQCWA
jgi:hypothetical protein